MRRSSGLLGVVAFAIVLAGGLLVYLRWPEWGEGIADLVGQQIEIPRPFGPPWVMRTIVLERGGGTLTPGIDDAPSLRSSVVLHGKEERAVIPAYKGSEASWRKLVDCVKARFAPFDVVVTEQRPEKDYVLTFVGGTSAAVGSRFEAAGLAPFNGAPIESPIVFVFSRSLKENVRAMCDTAAMEIAHAYGLDHEYLCRDPMTYLPWCGERSFQDVDAPCGEKKRRPCAGGAPTQNSFARLRDALGSRK